MGLMTRLGDGSRCCLNAVNCQNVVVCGTLGILVSATAQNNILCSVNVTSKLLSSGCVMAVKSLTTSFVV